MVNTLYFTMKDLLYQLKKAYCFTHATENIINGDPWVSMYFFSRVISQRTIVNDNLSYSLTNVVSTNICIRNIQPYNAGHSLSLEWKSLGWHTFSVIKRDNSTLDPYPRQNFTINNKNSLFILKPDILSLTVIPNPRQFLSCLVTMDEDCDLITDDLKDSMVQSNYLR